MRCSALSRRLSRPASSFAASLDERVARHWTPERLHWLGTSFGLTQQLFKFWHRVGLRPLYLRQTSNDLTGEHSIVMVAPLNCDGMVTAPKAGWLDSFVADFKRRFISLLSNQNCFGKFDTALALSILDFKKKEQLENHIKQMKCLGQVEPHDSSAQHSLAVLRVLPSQLFAFRGPPTDKFLPQAGGDHEAPDLG